MRVDFATWVVVIVVSFGLVMWLGVLYRSDPKPKPKPIVKPTVSTTIFTTTTFPHRVCVTSDGQWIYEAQQCVPDKER